jgi:hypothetical protein
LSLARLTKKKTPFFTHETLRNGYHEKTTAVGRRMAYTAWDAAVYVF